MSNERIANVMLVLLTVGAILIAMFIGTPSRTVVPGDAPPVPTEASRTSRDRINAGS